MWKRLADSGELPEREKGNGSLMVHLVEANATPSRDLVLLAPMLAAEASGPETAEIDRRPAKQVSSVRRLGPRRLVVEKDSSSASSFCRNLAARRIDLLDRNP